MQPPQKTVPPLVLPKPKPEKRVRKTPPSKSRTSKPKGKGSSSASHTDLSNPSLASEGSSGPLGATNSHPSVSPVNLGVVHPALKDAKLPALSNSSTDANITDQETVNDLLSTLFRRSLDPKSLANSKSLTSTLSPQKSTCSGNKKARQSGQSQSMTGLSESHAAPVSSTGTCSLFKITCSFVMSIVTGSVAQLGES